jgi:hypothetical protein
MHHPKLILGLAATFALGLGLSVTLASQPAAHADPAGPTVLAEVEGWQGVDQAEAFDGALIQPGIGLDAAEESAITDGSAAPLATQPPSPGPVPSPVLPPEGKSSVTIDRIYTTDVYGYPKTTFQRGESIQFVTRLLNRSTSTQRPLAEFYAAEPGWFPWCELSCRPLHRVFRGYISVPRGLWTYAVRARTDYRDPIGQWSYRMTITLGGNSQTRTTPFRLR